MSQPIQPIDPKISARFFDFAKFFYNIVTASLNQTIKSGNPDSTFCKPSDEPKKVYDKVTEWSDVKIIVPILFNFFHGTELWLKGAHYLKVAPGPSADHKLSSLWADFKTEHPNQTKLHSIFADFIEPTNNCSILQNFYKTNRIQNSDKFYELLKYPYDKKHQTAFDYKDIRHLNKGGTSFFQKIIDDIVAIEAERPNLYVDPKV